MANTYFQFKEFNIHQDACGMKVTTDACLFGAWVAHLATTIQPKHILDIGSGTGLLSLMLAQQTEAFIQTVEIDELAAQQAKQNIANSKWKDRIDVHHQDILSFKPAQSFDLIVTNPPFFENDLHSLQTQRNIALHSTQLSLSALYNCIHHLLSADGYFAILLPYHRTHYFENLAIDFLLQHKILVHQTKTHSAFRTMLLFSKKSILATKSETIFIKEDAANYSEAFIQLLKPYYLKL
jgi:tRNA1Val (adenine37-N6)-methyltransferase